MTSSVLLIFKWFVFPTVAVQLYSPDRPLVDTAEVFLWLMAVGTILCASYWSAWSAREVSIEHGKLLKVSCAYLDHIGMMSHACSDSDTGCCSY